VYFLVDLFVSHNLRQSPNIYTCEVSTKYVMFEFKVVEINYSRFGFERVQSRFEKINRSLNLEPNVTIEGRT